MNERENAYLSAVLFERSFGAEASADFILSDYQTEIRRILHVSQTVLPPSKYVGNDSAEFNGTIDYQVMYIGADGGIYSIPLSSDYSFSTPIDKAEHKDVIADVSVLCSVSPESVSTRVSSPRKLTIKSRLRPCVRAYAKIPATARLGSDASPTDVYKRMVSTSCVQCECGTSDVFSVSSTLPFDSEDIRVVFAESKIDVTDAQISGNSVCCKGNVLISLLCVSEESGQYKKLTAKTGFEGDVDTEQVLNGSVRVNGIPSEMSVTITDSGIECTVGILLQAEVCTDAPVEYTADVYSVKKQCDCVMRGVESRSKQLCRTSNFTVSERLPLSSTGIPEEAEILYTTASVNMDKCDTSDNKYVFSGNGVFTVIYKKEGDVYSSDVSVPIKYLADAESALPPACFDCTAWVLDNNTKVADGNLCIDAEIGISAECFASNKLSVVDRVVFGEDIPPREPEIVVCYPSASDSVWSVAKRYKVSPSKIIGDPTTDKFVMIE